MSESTKMPSGTDVLPISGEGDDRFLDLYEQMIGSVDIREVLQQIAKVVQKALDAQDVTVYVVRGEAQEIESITKAEGGGSIIRVPISDRSLAGYCALSKRAFLIPDAYGDLSSISPTLHFDKRWDKTGGFRTRDVMCAPAEFLGNVLGVVQVINSRRRSFEDADLETLRRVSRLVAYALHHARVYEELATLKALDKRKAEFMQIMVHELKSPVATSRAMVSTLEYVRKDDPQVTQSVSKIGARMDQLLVLIEEILQLSRIKSGDPIGDIRVFDMVAETRACCEPYLEHARQKGLAMSVDTVAGPLEIRFDCQGYRLVVSNLVSNAIKYTPEGSVKVEVGVDDGDAILRVADTGLGIPEADVPKLFREFYRASNARKNGISGTGVGLAGVRVLIERFSGTVELETKENQGTAFTVRLKQA